MTYSEIINKVSKDTGLDSSLVNKVYKAFWLFIKDNIQKLPLKDNMDEDTFNTLRTNFNIPSLGKLCCTYERYNGVKAKFRHISNIRENEKAEKDKTHV